MILTIQSGICIAGNSVVTETVNRCRDLLENDPGSAELTAGVAKLAGFLMIMDPDYPGISDAAEFLAGIPDNLNTVRVADARGHQYMLLKQADKASEIYLDLILRYTSWPDINRYRIALARSFRETGQFSQAVAQLESLLEQNSAMTPWVLLERARIYAIQDEPEKALSLYDRIIDRFDGSYPARLAASLKKIVLFNRILETGNESIE